ncbi:tyrosine-type recombinase/integrase [Allofournierella sp.]|uniref:tyrosine-type recombinase/integrase n=1 Tax=Allofournierella sp. TaxID=1940256 RepID=UPI003AB3C9A9
MHTKESEFSPHESYPANSYGAWLIYWIENFRQPGDVVKESTYVNYHYLARAYILPRLGRLSLDALGPEQLQEFFFFLRRAGRRQREGGISVKFLHDIYSLVNLSLQQALIYGRARCNPCAQVVLPPLKETHSRVLDLGEQYRIEAALAQNSDPRALAVWIALYAGLRVGEVSALTWGSVDLERRCLWVTQTMIRLQVPGNTAGAPKTKVVVSAPKTKTGKRRIPLPETLRALLAARRKTLAPALAQPGCFVVCQRNGRYWEPRALERYFEKVAAQAQVESAHFHCLRHTFATRSYELGMDLKTLSELLGHARPETTQKLYVHSLDEHKAAAIQVLDHLPWRERGAVPIPAAI